MTNRSEEQLYTQDIEEKEEEEKQDDDLRLAEETECAAEEEKLCGILELRINEVVSTYLKFRKDWWDDKRWNDYLYHTREPDVLQLPVLNEYLSIWEEDECYDEHTIFKECRNCLKIIDNLKLAIAACSNGNEKEVNLWQEGIENVRETVTRKLDFMSFMLLKDAYKYLDSKSENVQYGRAEGDENDCIITLCLWGNIYRPVRKREAVILGFSFRLPEDVVKEDCVVRVMHTTFNFVFPDQFRVQEDTFDEAEDVDVTSLDHDVSPDLAEERDTTTTFLSYLVKMRQNHQASEVDEGNEKRAEEEIIAEEADIENLQEENITTSEDEEIDVGKETIDDTVSDEESKKEPESSRQTSAIFDPKRLPPLIQPEVNIVDPDEYFIVGGIFYFELFVMPHITERKGAITYIHRELVKLRRILYKRRIVPPRKLDGDTSYTLTVYEKARFQKELSNAIYVQLKLPKNVLYLGNPEPALLFTEKGGYSTDCIFETRYDEDTRQISFLTNQFGIFGMLQKKYENFPYKSWSLTGGVAVILNLKGKCLDMKIEISNEGYTVTEMNPCDDLIFSEVNSKWMFAELLIEKLRNVGINIAHGQYAYKFVNVSKKAYSIENKAYDCIALLSRLCSFRPVDNSPSPKGEIHLEFTIGNEEKIRNVVVRKNEAALVSGPENHEVTETEKEEIEDLRMEEGVPDENKNEQGMAENPNIEKGMEQDSNEKDLEMQSEIIDKPGLYSDLYSLVMAEMKDEEKEAVINTDARLIENVRSLLRICRPISSM